MRVILLLCTCMFLAACATTAKYRAKLDSWQGRNINDFVKVWGYPNQKTTAPDGNTLYVYYYRDTVTYPTQYNPGNTYVSTEGGKTIVSSTAPSFYGGGTYHYRCTTWVEVNKNGTIVNTAFRGNDCTSN